MIACSRSIFLARSIYHGVEKTPSSFLPSSPVTILRHVWHNNMTFMLASFPSKSTECYFFYCTHLARHVYLQHCCPMYSACVQGLARTMVSLRLTLYITCFSVVKFNNERLSPPYAQVIVAALSGFQTVSAENRTCLRGDIELPSV